MWIFGIILILVAALLGAVTSHPSDDSMFRLGTAIIAVVHPESRIVLAVDSKRLFIPLDKPELEVSSICKINKLSDSIFFVATGFFGRQTFRVPDVVRKAVAEANNLPEAIQLAEARLKAGFEKNLLEIRSKSPDVYRSESERLQKLEVFFFGAQIGKLFIHRREFRARNLPDKIPVDVIRNSCPGNWCQGGHSFLVFAGRNKAISQYQNNNPIRFTVTEEVKWINSAMNAQIKATPQDVGSPINIVSIKPTGETQWIQGEDQCKL
jgi:hypothetical protein